MTKAIKEVVSKRFWGGGGRKAKPAQLRGKKQNQERLGGGWSLDKGQKMACWKLKGREGKGEMGDNGQRGKELTQSQREHQMRNGGKSVIYEKGGGS